MSPKTSGMRDGFLNHYPQAEKRFWDLMEYKFAFSNITMAFVPPELHKVPFDNEAVNYLVATQPYTILRFLDARLCPLESIFESQRYSLGEEGDVRAPDFCFADQIPNKRTLDGILFIFKDLKTMLKNCQEFKDPLDILFTNFSYIRVRQVESAIYILGLEYQKVAIAGLAHISRQPGIGVFQVKDKPSAVRYFSTCIVKSGEFDPDILNCLPKHAELRQLFEVHGIGNKDLLCKAINFPIYYGSVVDTYHLLAKCQQKPLEACK